MPDQLTPDDFEPHVGSQFVVSGVAGDVGAVTMTLTAVNRRAVRDHGERTEPFALVFAAPPGTSLPQRAYMFEHDEIGEITIFVVPIGPDPQGMRLYEAVFN